MKVNYQPAPARIPLKPRKKLFMALLVVYAVWLAALLTMYFTTHRV